MWSQNGTRLPLLPMLTILDFVCGGEQLCSASCIFSHVGSPSMGVIASVLNFALMSLPLTLGMVGMNMSSPDDRTVMLGLLFSKSDADPDVAF